MTRLQPQFRQDRESDVQGGVRNGVHNGVRPHGEDAAHAEPFDDAIDAHERDLHSAGVQPLRRALAARQAAPQNRGMSEPNGQSAVPSSADGSGRAARGNGVEREATAAAATSTVADSPPTATTRASHTPDTAPGAAHGTHDRRANGHDGDGQANDEPLGPDDPLAPLPFNPYKGNRGVTRAWHAMKNSLAGFRVAIREESAFRQELTLAAILVPCGVLVPVDAVARVLLLGSVLLVLIVELLNSSVEAAIDRISLERHELSRRAKDLGSAAVMVALGMCVMTWGLIVGPLVVHWVRSWF